MKLSETLNDAFSEQITHELLNSNSYLQMAIYFDIKQFRKLASYFMKQAQHERDHADKFIQYVCSRIGGFPTVAAIPAPMVNLSNHIALAQEYVKLEEATTASIEGLYALAQDEQSWMDLEFLLTMLKEQVEEEDEAERFLLMISEAKDLALFDLAWE